MSNEKTWRCSLCSRMAALSVLGGLMFVGCSGGGGSGGGGGPSTGTLQAGLADGPGPFRSVILTVKEIRLVPAGEDPAENGGLPRIDLGTPREIDIVPLQFQQTLLGSVELPAGTYNQLRLVLDSGNTGAGGLPANRVVLNADGRVEELKTPSGQQSGVKVLGQFEVRAGQLNAILVEFDPEKAIVETGNGKFLLKPTGIRIEQMMNGAMPSSFGTATGRIVSSDSSKNTSLWSNAMVCVADSASGQEIVCGKVFLDAENPDSADNGKFTAHVPSGSYFLRVRAAGFVTFDGSASGSFFTVTSGSTTDLGTATLSPTP
ncbi:MAG: DUF4382 domain-containing protein [Planctomycetes bacterium]|nr:DUF4382 domain-containing protein [Planctomycetota bacterium]